MSGRPGATPPGQKKTQQQAGKAEETKAAAILHGSVFVVGKLEVQFDGIGAVITAVTVVRGNVLDQVDAQTADGTILSDVSGVAISMNGSKDVPQSRIQTQRNGALSMLTRLKPSSI